MAFGKASSLACVRRQLSLTQLRNEVNSIPPKSSIVFASHLRLEHAAPAGASTPEGPRAGSTASTEFFGVGKDASPGIGDNNLLFPALASGDIKYIFIPEKFHALVTRNLPLPCSTQFSLDITGGILLSHHESISPPDRDLLAHPRPLLRRAIKSLVVGEATAHARQPRNILRYKQWGS